MRRQSFAWVAFAALTLGLIADPRLDAVPANEVGAVEIAQADTERAEPRSRGDRVVRASLAPVPDLLDVPTLASPTAPEAPVVAAVAAEPPVEPDSSTTTAAPPVQVRAPAPPPVVRAPVVAPPPRVVPAPVVAPPPPATCPPDRFCYPRVGISGSIVPYGDCTGSTDVGTAIRSLTCVSPTYLAAHAYTQFGRIAGWSAGDIVFVYGVRYVIYDGFTQPGCVAPARAIAPLSLQTSLTSATCGPILVVQGRRG